MAVSVSFSDGGRTVVFDGVDAPESVTSVDAGSLSSQIVELSDGSRLLSHTATVPQDLTLTGVLLATDRYGSPLDKIKKLAAMRDSARPVTFRWTGNSTHASFPVVVQDIKAEVIKNSQVQYTLTLFRPAVSGLSGGRAQPAQANQRAARSVSALAAHSSSVPPGTQNAIVAVSAAARAAARG